MNKSHVKIASEAAIEAGGLLKENFCMIKTIERKADQSLVTNLDKSSEKIIVERLHQAFPDYRIIGEETGSCPAAGEYTWVIDPLDGTHNYIRSIPVYGVSIGLMKGSEFVAGVIYIPQSDDLYAAEAGGGAWKNGKRIAVSACSKLEESSLSFDSGFRTETAKKVHVMQELATRVFNVRMSGSSARNLSFLAEGIMDIVVEFDDRIWDFCAAVTIIREAGGKFTNHSGTGLDGDRGCYVATNGKLHDQVVAILGENP